jgi:WD40 repeat protein
MLESIIAHAFSSVKEKPYPGLRSFKAGEADLFFGREEQVDQLLEKLNDSHFIAVIGPSGCGKSSLVRAGLIPALKTGFLADAGARWRVVEMRPSNQPIHNLAQAIHNSFQEDIPVEFLQAELKRGPKALIDIVRNGNLRANENLLVIVDQFEELFRFRQNNNIEEVTAFINLLIASAKQSGVSIHIVITMRSDYLGECSLFYDLPEILNNNQFLTPRLSREQCKKAIIGPALVCNGSIEPELVNRLLNDLGVNHDQLPLLQHALMRMWNSKKISSGETGTSGERVSLTLQDYEAVGKINDALSRHVNEVYESLDERQKSIAEKMFKRLTDRNSQKEPIRRPSSVKEIADVVGVSIDEVIAVANRFRAEKYNFLMPDEVELTTESILDISHESLMRQWDKLKKWMEEEEDSARKYRWLSDAVKFNSAYLRGIDLKNALQWKKTENPNQVWSQRYSDNLQEVITYINKSQTSYRNNIFRNYGLVLLIAGSIVSAAFTQLRNNNMMIKLKSANFERISERRLMLEKEKYNALEFEKRIQENRSSDSFGLVKGELIKQLKYSNKELLKTNEDLSFQRDKFLKTSILLYQSNFENSKFNTSKQIDGYRKNKVRDLLMRLLNNGEDQAFVSKLNAFDQLASTLDYMSIDPNASLSSLSRIMRFEKDTLAAKLALEMINKTLFVKQELIPDYKNDSSHTIAFAFSKDKKRFVYNVESKLFIGEVYGKDSLERAETENHRKLTPHITSLAFINKNEVVGRTKEELVFLKDGIETKIKLPVDASAFCEISPDGSLLFSTYKGNSSIWRIADLKQDIRKPVQLKGTGKVYAVAFSSDGGLVATGYGEGCTIWSRNGELIASITENDMASKHSSQKNKKYASVVTAISFSPRNNSIFIGTFLGGLMIWDYQENKVESIDLASNLSEIRRLNVSPDGKKILASSESSSSIVFLDLDQPDRGMKYMANSDSLIMATEFLDNQTIVSAEYNGTFKVWKIYPEFPDINKAFNTIKTPTSVLVDLEEMKNAFQSNKISYYDLLKSNDPDSLYVAAEYYYAYGSENKDFLNKSKQLFIRLSDVKKGDDQIIYLMVAILINDHLNELDSLNHFGIVERYKQSIRLRQKIMDIGPPDQFDKRRELSYDHGMLARHQLYIKDFDGAIETALKGIEIFPANDWIYRNLALGYLLSGKFDKAEIIYKKYKDRPYSESSSFFKDYFLADLDTLESDGIISIENLQIHSMLPQIRALLK